MYKTYYLSPPYLIATVCHKANPETALLDVSLVYCHPILKDTMKKIIYLFILPLFALNSVKVNAIDYVLFSGTIENPVGKTASVTNGEYTMKFQLDEKNSFSDTLYIPSAGYYSFATGRESSAMYLNPGDVIKVSLNTEEFDESIAYSGKGAEKNNYLAKKYMQSELNGPDFEGFFGSDENTFTTINNKIFSSEEELLKNSSIADKNFIAVESKALKYDYIANLTNYEEYHIHFSQNAEFKVSDEFYAKLKGFDYTNEADYKTYGSYRTIVANHYIEAIDTKEELEITFASIQDIKSDYIKNDLLTNFKYSFSPAHTNLKTFYTLLMETSTDEAYKEKLTTKYNLIKNLTPGNVSPSFTYPDKDGVEVSLDMLKGKFVYVDVWATWCGPCKREIPYLKEMTKAFEGKDVAFVSISIDEQKDYEKWKTMLNEKEMDGIQLFADNAWASKFVKEYAIQGIPRFILIDKEGIIISADADRPSNPELTELLNDLL